jgi:hypothetical protein
VEAVEHPPIGTGGELRGGVGRDGHGLVILTVRLFKRAGQYDAIAAHLGRGQQDVDAAQKVGMQRRENCVQTSRPAHVTRQMEDQIGSHLSDQRERPLGITDVGRPPADDGARLLGTRDAVHFRTRIEKSFAEARAYKPGGAGHERLLPVE